MPEWTWNEEEQQYADEEGNLIPWAAIVVFLYARLDTTLPIVDRLAILLATASIGLSVWEIQMRLLIMDEFIQSYLLGRGGLEQMGPGDWLILGEMLRQQFAFLDDFARAIADGLLSESQIEWRSRLYINAAQQAYWRALQESQGWPQLPAYPGDCTTRCCTNCRCHWEVVFVVDHWEATWVLDFLAEHCEDCVVRSIDWAPLILEA